MGLKHRDSGKSDASLHRFAYWSESDPASTHGLGADGVEAGQSWVQHESGAPDTIVDVFIRNEANDGWVSILVKTPDHTHSGDEVLITEKEEAGGTYTLVLSDAGKMISFTNGSSAVVTIPPNSSVAFTIGTLILFRQESTGPVTIQGGSGVTVEAEGGKDTTVGQYAVARALKIGTNQWALFGNLAAAS